MSTGTIRSNCEGFVDELRQRPRQFIYAIVAEPDVFVLYKAYTNNGAVRLAEFKTLAGVETSSPTCRLAHGGSGYDAGELGGSSRAAFWRTAPHPPTEISWSSAHSPNELSERARGGSAIADFAIPLDEVIAARLPFSLTTKQNRRFRLPQGRRLPLRNL